MKKLAALLFACCLLAVTAISVSAAYELTPYDVPSNGVHFSFDGTYKTDNGELEATPRGEIEFIDGHDGTANGAVYLDALDETIELLKEDYWGNWSISAWLRTDEVINWGFLTMSRDYSVRYVQYAHFLGEPGISHHKKDFNMKFDPNYALPLGEWAMLTFTHEHETGTVVLYLNGERVEEAQMEAFPLPLTLIGHDSSDLLGYLVVPYAGIDDLWMFGRVLSDEDVKSLYENNSVPAVEEGFGKLNVADPNALTPYDVPAEGRHFSFDGTYTDDSGELVGEAKGSIVSAADRTGKADGAIYLDSDDDHIRLMKAPYEGDAWTVSAWLKLDEYVQNSFLLMSVSESGDLRPYCRTIRPGQQGTEGLIGISNGMSGDANAHRITAESASLPLGEWAMLTMTYTAPDAAAVAEAEAAKAAADEAKAAAEAAGEEVPESEEIVIPQGEVKIYINGAYVESLANNMPLPLALIGNDANEGGKGWQTAPMMSMDDLWIFGKALTDEEITKLYTENSIGTVPAAEEPVVKEEVVETPAVEEPKEEVVETPAVEEPVHEEVVEAPAAAAPQTFDIAAVLAVLTAICGVGLTVIRKRK